MATEVPNPNLQQRKLTLKDKLRLYVLLPLVLSILPLMCIGYFYLIRPELPEFTFDRSTDLIIYEATIEARGQSASQVWSSLPRLIDKFRAFDQYNFTLSPLAFLQRDIYSDPYTFKCTLRDDLYESVRRFRQTRRIRVGEVTFEATFKAIHNGLTYRFTNFKMTKGGDNPFSKIINRSVATDQDYAYYLRQVDAAAKGFIKQTTDFIGSQVASANE